MNFQGASSSSSTRSRRYDVFLNFTGEDIPHDLIGNLSRALLKNGVNSFINAEQLRSGEDINPAVLEAIEQSEISIVLFSKNYASSRWCLDELLKILECKETKGQEILPVFYKVNPLYVRNQMNSFEEAFARHEEGFKDDQMKVQRWKAALTDVANISWCCIVDHRDESYEAAILDKIVQLISETVNPTFVHAAKHPVGIESLVQEINSLLSIERNDVRMVGILGAGGIGKTTIAKAIYNSIFSQFEGSCFLANVRKTSKEYSGMVTLQNTLLWEILGHTENVESVDEGIIAIKKSLCSKRVLLILDDVDELVQLDKLVGEVDWFGLGSRIIITTRDKKVLTNHGGVDLIYKVKELEYNKALELFCWNAFNGPTPHFGFVEVSKDAVCYCGGLPLALTVLGSFLKGRGIREWERALDRCKRIPLRNIQEILKISYDGLHENSKNIFLDIACFFKGENVEYVTKILDSCGLRSCSGIEELMDKCLITQSCGSLMMHDLLQEMGREIVRQESPDKPGNRTRLWFHEDVHDVLEDNAGTNNVEGILIDLSEADLIKVSSKALMKMKRLKLLICRNAHFSKEVNFLPHELRLLYWPEYPGEFLPTDFHGKNLAVLRMPRSHLKGLEGVENFQNLTIMNFTGCEFLKKVPDVSRILNLMTLILDGCIRLVEVHRSVGFLDKLVDLSLENCSNLRSFPRSLKLRSLESLVLCGCSSLKDFPKIECPMECLEYVDFQYTGIEKLPSSIRYLVGVKKLYLAGCRNLTILPESINQLQHLERLNLMGCTSIKRLPSSIGYLVRVKTLDLGGCTNLMNIPNSIYQLQHLEQLDLKGCSKIVKFPDSRQFTPSFASKEESENLSEPELVQLALDPNDGCSSILFPKLQRLDLRNCALSESNFFKTFDCGSTLNRLDLSGSDIVALPLCIRTFVQLKFLYLNECKQLQKILGLPPNVVEVSARGCKSLEILLEEPRRSQLFNMLYTPQPVWSGMQLSAMQSSSLGKSFVGESNAPFNSLEDLDLSSSAIVSLPTWFNRFVRLKRLTLKDCKQLREISKLPPNIGEVYAHGCTSLERFQSSHIDLPKLGWIDLSDCHKLHENMGNDLQIRLLNEGHHEDHKFVCMFPGNKIPDWFSHREEVLNSNSCKMDINEAAHLDGEITRIAFSAVIGTKADIPDVQDEITESGQEEDAYGIIFKVISDGVKIYSFVEEDICGQFHSDHVWLHYNVPESFKLKGDNLQVKFKLRSASMFFKSCGFHMVRRYEEKAVDLMDRGQLSQRPHDDNDDDGNFPQQKRHSSTLGIRISDAEVTP